MSKTESAIGFFACVDRQHLFEGLHPWEIQRSNGEDPLRQARGGNRHYSR
jgi:hypothetical protein